MKKAKVEKIAVVVAIVCVALLVAAYLIRLACRDTVDGLYQQLFTGEEFDKYRSLDDQLYTIRYAENMMEAIASAYEGDVRVLISVMAEEEQEIVNELNFMDESGDAAMIFHEFIVNDDLGRDTITDAIDQADLRTQVDFWFLSAWGYDYPWTRIMALVALFLGPILCGVLLGFSSELEKEKIE